MINDYDGNIFNPTIAQILMSSFFRNLIGGLSTIYVAIRFIISLNDVIFPRTSLVSFMNSLIFSYLIPRMIGLVVIAFGMHLVADAVRFITFYFKNVRPYHKKDVKIKTKEDSPFKGIYLEGTLFIEKGRIAVVDGYSSYSESKSISYSIINKNNLNYIERLYIDDIEIKGIEDYFEYLMDKF